MKPILTQILRSEDSRIRRRAQRHKETENGIDFNAKARCRKVAKKEIINSSLHPCVLASLRSFSRFAFDASAQPRRPQHRWDHRQTRHPPENCGKTQ